MGYITSAALHGGEAAESGIRALQLLHDQAIFDIAHARAAVAFQIRAQKTEPAEFRDQLFGETGVAEAIANQRDDAIFNKLPGGLADQQFLFREERVYLEIINAGEAGHSPIVALWRLVAGDWWLVADGRLLCHSADYSRGQSDHGPHQFQYAPYRNAD